MQILKHHIGLNGNALVSALNKMRIKVSIISMPSIVLCCENLALELMIKQGD